MNAAFRAGTGAHTGAPTGARTGARDGITTGIGTGALMLTLFASSGSAWRQPTSPAAAAVGLPAAAAPGLPDFGDTILRVDRHVMRDGERLFIPVRLS